MAKRIRRRNEGALVWLNAAFISAVTFAALAGMEFRPDWGAAALALSAGALSLAAVDLGILASMLALSLPVAAANPVVGIAFLVLGIVGMRYLGADGGRVFLVVASAVAGSFIGPLWASAAVAGYLLGASEGALAAGIACGTAELIGLLLGRSSLTALTTGGTESSRLLVFGGEGWPASFFASGWLKDTFAGFGNESVQQVVDAFAAIQEPVALIAQPLLWALAAVLTGTLLKRARRSHAPAISIAGAAAGALLPVAGAFALRSAGQSALSAGTIAASAVTSVVVAMGFVLVAERFFPLQVVKPARSSKPSTMATEDADVDELLRLISTAEEKLSTHHTTTKIVMITDMKSFSRMTEEDGSILSAKAIQKHRDLLLPLIETHGGHGKSTGGDGLIAAFDTAAGALEAAAEMQRALDAQNETHPSERQMTVRIGVAEGEVVLDNGGRPFIGAALNTAARVMNLADGGQAFATAAVVQAGGSAVTTTLLGEFELKNIAKPVSVFEVLWAPGQQPGDPRKHED